jgi:hypothetical protein
VEPRAGLDGLEKRKLLSLPGLELRPLFVQSIASRSPGYKKKKKKKQVNK